MWRAFVLVVVSSTFIPNLATADRLPKTATPMSTEEVKAFYSGKSSKWRISSAYFAPDGTVKGISGLTKKGVPTGLYWGTWSVTENEACMKVDWKDLKSKKSGKDSIDCWKWWRDGKKTWSLWSVQYTGKKPKKSDYFDKEAKLFSEGDQVTETFDKFNKP